MEIQVNCRVFDRFIDVAMIVLKCKVLLQYWIGSKPYIVFTIEKLDEWADLLIWVFVSHMIVLYQIKCLRPHRRPDWFLPFGVNHGVGLTSGYR